MEFGLLLLSTLFFFAAGLHTLLALRQRRDPSRWLGLSLFGGGFLWQSCFLYLRGQAFGACPLGTFADVLVFLGWAIVLIYWLIGPAYRLSLLGAFTAPLVLALQIAALATLRPLEIIRLSPPNPWVELHAALSVMAYGAFGLAGVAGLMYLIQEHLLKKHRLSALFYELPPIQDLTTANSRLLLLGFILLTIAFAAGALAERPVEALKIYGSALIWLLYGLLLFLRHRHQLSPRRLARLSLAAFALVMVTLPGIHYLSRL